MRFTKCHLQMKMSIFNNEKAPENKGMNMHSVLFCNRIEEKFNELKEKGIEEAENGNFGRALSLLSHAFNINNEDYKLCEMIAQVRILAYFRYCLVYF